MIEKVYILKVRIRVEKKFEEIDDIELLIDIIDI